MNRIGILVFSFLLCFASNAQHSKVLFIGNSYTSTNNLPALISDIYSSLGGSLEYLVSAPGGCTFSQHCTVSLPYIQQGDFDFVVLQEQSQLPSFPDADFYQNSYPYAAQLCSLISQYNSHATPVFYMTWGRKDGDQMNCPEFQPLCTYEGMDSLLCLRYKIMADDNHALLSPVGKVWHFIRDNYPYMELYQSDGSHPSYLGSYAAACCFYTIFSHIDPTLIPTNNNLALEQDLAIKNAVKTVVYDSLQIWDYTTSPDTSSNEESFVGDFIPDNTISIYPNPSNNGILTVNIPDDVEVSLISFFNYLGQFVLGVHEFDRRNLNISNLNKGFYTVVFHTDKGDYSKKIIYNK